MFNDVKTWDVLPLNETKANTNLCFIAHLLSPSQVPGVSDEVYPPLELVATEAVATKNALGESPVWSDKEHAIYWVS